MKRFPALGILLLIPALVMFGIIGCTSKDGKTGKTTEMTTGPEKTTAGKKEDITTTLEATVKGKVKFNGAPPERKVIAAIKDHKDAPICNAGDTKEQMWIVDNDGGVANVIIVLGPPADKKFNLEKVKELSKGSAAFDQPQCAFVPHIVALWPDAQTLVSKNSSKVNHNTKLVAGQLLGGTKDLLIPPGKQEEVTYKNVNTENLVNVECSVHPWMSAKVALFPHPYFAVTDSKGEFEIKNVPIDVELTVYQWHESMGDLKSKAKVKDMKFSKGPNDVGTIDIGK